MEISIKFHFRKSKSKNFKDVIKLAREFEHFSIQDEESFELIIHKNELFEKWTHFALLHHYITKWAGTQVWFKNKLIIPYSNKFFYAIQQVHSCFKECYENYDKESFCFEDDIFKGWGCYHIKSIRRYISDYHWNYWYKHGKFIESSKWAIDKQKIKQILINEINSKYLNICPLFDYSRIFKSIESLPELIDLNRDQGWQIEYAPNFVGSSFINVPVGISHVAPDEENQTPLKEESNDENEMRDIIKSKKFENLTDSQINKLIDFMKKHKLNNDL